MMALPLPLTSAEFARLADKVVAQGHARPGRGASNEAIGDFVRLVQAEHLIELYREGKLPPEQMEAMRILERRGGC